MTDALTQGEGTLEVLLRAAQVAPGHGQLAAAMPTEAQALVIAHTLIERLAAPGTRLCLCHVASQVPSSLGRVPTVISARARVVARSCGPAPTSAENP